MRNKMREFIATKLFIITLLLSVTVTSCNERTNDTAKSEVINLSDAREELENEAWQMEEKYWIYVKNNDTISYKTLWHDEFIGYPSFGDGVSNKNKIAIWIPELHADENLKFSYKLFKKATNAIDDVVIVFYDTDQIWTDQQDNIVKKETLKVTHTWKKYADNWVILGGMAGKK
jgi:hypothetical protein